MEEQKGLAMTNQPEPPVEVTQADRDAAARVYRQHDTGIFPSQVASGACDDNPDALPQHFARHRLASQRPAVGDEDLETWWERIRNYPDGWTPREHTIAVLREFKADIADMDQLVRDDALSFLDNPSL